MHVMNNAKSILNLQVRQTTKDYTVDKLQHLSTHSAINTAAANASQLFPPSSLLTLNDWLILSFIKGVGPARLARLRQYLEVLNSQQRDQLLSPELLATVLTKEVLMQLKWPAATADEAIAYLLHGKVTKAAEYKVAETQSWLQTANHYLISQDDQLYPAQLKEIDVPPQLLYVVGDIKVLQQPMLGIVGARRCSAYGRDSAFYFSKNLSELGVTVVSGGALGVDTAAHAGAIAANVPTVAVMGAGLKNLYPKTNQALFEDILACGGAIVSEYPLSTPVKANLFPPRNRIISGLSMGVFIVEASLKSGSLITASYALQQNREVFALPGRTTDKQSIGTLNLIQQGAKLVMQIEDIIVELPELTLPLSKPIITSKQENAAKQINVRKKKLCSSQQTRKNSNEMGPETLAKQNVSREITAKMDKQTSVTGYSSSIQQKSQQTILSATRWDDSLIEPSRSVIACIDELLKSSSWERQFDFNELMAQLSLSSSALSQALIELELLGLIENNQLGYRRTFTSDRA